jgi:hypothetical protein
VRKPLRLLTSFNLEKNVHKVAQQPHLLSSRDELANANRLGAKFVFVYFTVNLRLNCFFFLCSEKIGGNLMKELIISFLPRRSY